MKYVGTDDNGIPWYMTLYQPDALVTIIKEKEMTDQNETNEAEVIAVPEGQQLVVLDDVNVTPVAVIGEATEDESGEQDGSEEGTAAEVSGDSDSAEPVPATDQAS